MEMNTTVRLARRPVGSPVADDWVIADEPMPTVGEGQFLVRTTYISLDPAMRGWLDDRPSYLPPVGLGEVMRAGTVGEVVQSRHPKYPIGTIVQSTGGVQSFALSDGRGVTKVDPVLGSPSTYLGVLGITGLTAYFGLLEHGRPRPGDTVVVSGAAGAVGTIVGQLARINGCRTIGIAGGPEKCRMVVDEFGFDVAIDYRDPAMRKELRAAAPDGIDVYFDNVGGEVLNAALASLAMHARVVICGAISQYNAEAAVPGPSNYLSLLVRRATMSGFLVFDYEREYATARRRLATWVAQGRITAPETIVEGQVSDFHEVFMRLFSGDNVGKLLLSIQG